MDPISNVDQLVLLLRQRLAERTRATGPKGARRVTLEAPPPRSGVQALAAVDGVDERQVRRALIQSLLSERLGPGLLNEARFQHVVDQVTDTLEGDTQTAGLLDRVMDELRAEARL